MINNIRIASILAWSLAGLLRAGAGLLVVDADTSYIQVAVSSTADSFAGVLEKYDAAIEAAPSDRLPSKAEVKFDFKDLKTGNVKRDKAMLEWMGYTNHPGAAFRLTDWKQDGTNTVASGEFTLHGVTHTMAIPVRVEHEGDNWSITGRTEINHLDYGLPKIRKLAVLTVDPRLKVRFELHLKAATEPPKK
jgi:polyisoprenoid-binding protein YceI